MTISDNDVIQRKLRNWHALNQLLQRRKCIIQIKKKKMNTDQNGKDKGLSELKIDNNMCSSCLIFRQYNNYQCICMLIGLGLWCLTPLSTIGQYIVAVSFIGGKTARVPREACQEIYFLFKLSITWPLSKRSRSHIIAYGKLTWYLV